VRLDGWPVLPWSQRNNPFAGKLRLPVLCKHTALNSSSPNGGHIIELLEIWRSGMIASALLMTPAFSQETARAMAREKGTTNTRG